MKVCVENRGVTLVYLYMYFNLYVCAGVHCSFHDVHVHVHVHTWSVAHTCSTDLYILPDFALVYCVCVHV